MQINSRTRIGTKVIQQKKKTGTVQQVRFKLGFIGEQFETESEFGFPRT